MGSKRSRRQSLANAAAPSKKRQKKKQYKQQQQQQQQHQLLQPLQQRKQQHPSRDDLDQGLDYILRDSSIAVRQFCAEYLGKKPFVVSREQNREFFGELFSLHKLLQISNLKFGAHVNAFRFDSEKQAKETYVAEGSGDDEHPSASADTLRHLLKGGWSLQVHQPQTRNSALRRLLTALERQLGSLVGSNLYVTPERCPGVEGCQGLAPHWDDVDVLVLQLEGNKAWQLFELPFADSLPLEPSGDLPREELGEPLMEVTLRPGDVMYMPRGLVHVAVAVPSDDGKDFGNNNISKEGIKTSTHLTISWAQEHCFGALLRAALPLALEEALEEDVHFRMPLPPALFRSLGIIHQDGVAVETKETDDLSEGMQVRASPTQVQSLVQREVRRLCQRLQQRVLSQLHHATDALALDYVNNRLPPATSTRDSRAANVRRIMEARNQALGILEALLSGQTNEESVWRRVLRLQWQARGPDATRVVAVPREALVSHSDDEDDDSDAEDDIEEEEEEEEEEDEALAKLPAAVAVFSSLRNDPRLHMNDFEGTRQAAPAFTMQGLFLPALKLALSGQSFRAEQLRHPRGETLSRHQQAHVLRALLMAELLVPTHCK